MPMPRIEGAAKKVPLCYDPARKKFIFFDDIVAGTHQVIPVETLSAADLKVLIIERQRRGPNYVVQSMSGPPLDRDAVVRAIEHDEPIGRQTVEVETSYLKELLEDIRANL
jgi:hypothetical protein